MAGWTCASCSTPYGAGAARCPNCGSTSIMERNVPGKANPELKKKGKKDVGDSPQVVRPGHDTPTADRLP